MSEACHDFQLFLVELVSSAKNTDLFHMLISACRSMDSKEVIELIMSL